MEKWRSHAVSLFFVLRIVFCVGFEMNTTRKNSTYVADLGSTVEIRCNSSIPDNPVWFIEEGKLGEDNLFPVTWGHQTRSGNLTKLVLDNLRYNNAGRYTCRWDNFSYRDALGLVVIDPGVKIINWTCSSNDLEWINCTADYQREAFKHTKWELTIQPSGMNIHVTYPSYKNEGFIKCLFKKPTFSTDRYELNLTAVNKWFADENYYHNVTISPHIAVLAAPELSVVRKQSSEIQIQISYNHSELLNYIQEHSVVCVVEVQTFNSTETVEEQEEKLLNSSTCSVNLTDLKPYTNYNISVKCRLDLSETLYSTSSNITTRTAQDLPEKAPTVEIDSYSIDDDCKGKGTFGVQLYWKELSAQSGFGNGPILHYDIQLSDRVMNRVPGSKFSAHVCVKRGLTHTIHVYPVNKVGRGRKAAKFMIQGTLSPSLNSCMVKGEIILGDHLSRSSELQINIITHSNKLQDYRIYSCKELRGVCQSEYAILENPFITRSVRHIRPQYTRLDTLTTPYIENIRYGVSVNNTSGGITWIDCINTQQSQVTDFTPEMSSRDSEIELRWPTSCSNTPSDHIMLSVNYCLIDEDRCMKEEYAGLWTIACNSKFLMHNLQHKSSYKIWFTTLNSTNLLKEPLLLKTHKREMRIYEIALIIPSTIILCVLLILLAVCIRRQRTLWKRYKAPLVVQVADLKLPLSDSASNSNNSLSRQNQSDPYFIVSAVDGFQTAGGPFEKSSNNVDDWGLSQDDRSLKNRSKDYLIAKPKPIQHVELDTYQPNNITPLQMPDKNMVTTCNSDDVVSLISEESCSINSNGITSSDMCKYLTETPLYLQLNYQTLNPLESPIECKELPSPHHDVDYLMSGDSDLQGTDKYFLDSDTHSRLVSPNTYLSPEYVPADIRWPTPSEDGRLSLDLLNSLDALLRSDSVLSGSSQEGSYVSETSCDAPQSPLGGTSGDSGYIAHRTKTESLDDKLKP